MTDKGNVPWIFQGGIPLGFPISVPFKDMSKQNVLSSDKKQSLKCQKLALSLLCPSIIYSLGTYMQEGKKKCEIAVPSYHLSVKCLCIAVLCLL